MISEAAEATKTASEAKNSIVIFCDVRYWNIGFLVCWIHFWCHFSEKISSEAAEALKMVLEALKMAPEAKTNGFVNFF